MNEHVTPRRIELLIGSEWRSGLGGAPLVLTSPATGETIASVEQGTAADVDAAVLKAEAALPILGRMTAFERAALCHKVADVIASRREAFARDISLEQGKVYHSEALGEVDAAVLMYRDSAECATRLQGETYQSVDPTRRVMTIRQPRGVYGVITPWNFPLTIPSEYLGAGLATGNAMVWKPSEWTPLTSRNLMQAFLDAGVPEGTLNLLLGAPADVGAAVASHHRIVAIGLTGSTRTGLAVARLAAGKPMLLELGGNGPTIVFEDCDLDRAAAVVGVDLLMIEQPLGYHDIYEHSKLQPQLKTSVCLDESIHSADDLRLALDLGACRILNLKPCRVSGYTESLEIYRMCVARDIPLWVGGMMETGIGRASNLAFASLPGVTLPCDISATDRYFNPDITEPPFVLRPDSTIAVAPGYGIGVEVVREAPLFDCVFVDPPFFSVTEKGRVDLEQDMVRLLNKVRPLVAHNGYLVAINNAAGKPALVAVEAWLLFGETLTPIQIAGMALTIVGVALASRR